MLQKLDRIAIRNILSIRYNPNEKPIISPLTWKNCVERYSDPRGIHTEKLLMNSISKKIFNSNKPLIVSLSSGIDSSLCLSLLRKVFPNTRIVALCGVFSKYNDESLQAKKIAYQFDADFKTVKMPSIFTYMPEIISITKKPRWNTYQHIIAKEAKKYGQIFVTGDGADEIFGGYTFRYSKFLNLTQPRDSWKLRIINYLECHNRDWVPDQDYLFDKSMKFRWESIHEYFKPYFENKLKPLQQVMLADFNGKLLHDFIPASKSICEYYGLIPASIFLDSEVIKFGMALNVNEKYNNMIKKGKLILRNIADRHKINHIEEKRGFSPDLWLDWKKFGKKICENFIMKNDAYIFKKKIINFNWILRAFESIENDNDVRYLNRLISILALEIWYRVFITREIESTQKLS